MPEHVGEPSAATAPMAAIEAYTASDADTPPDLGGTATIAEVTEAIVGMIEGRDAGQLAFASQTVCLSQSGSSALWRTTAKPASARRRRYSAGERLAW